MKQKGQAVLIMILVVTVLLAVVIGFMSLVTKEIKIQRNLSDSIAAYYVAETGIELAVQEVKNGGTTSPAGCDAFDPLVLPDNTVIKCVGQVNNTRRAIKAEIPTNTSPGEIIRPVFREVSP